MNDYRCLWEYSCCCFSTRSSDTISKCKYIL